MNHKLNESLFEHRNVLNQQANSKYVDELDRSILTKGKSILNKVINVWSKHQQHQNVETNRSQSQFVFESQTSVRQSMMQDSKKITLTQKPRQIQMQNQQLSQYCLPNFNPPANPPPPSISLHLKQMEQSLIQSYRNKITQLQPIKASEYVYQKLLNKWTTNACWLEIDVLGLIDKGNKNRNNQTKNRKVGQSLNVDKHPQKKQAQPQKNPQNPNPRIQQSKQFLESIQNHKPNKYHLLSDNTITTSSIPMTQFTMPIIKAQHLNQILQPNRKANNLFVDIHAQQNVNMIQLHKNYLASRQVIDRFVEIQITKMVVIDQFGGGLGKKCDVQEKIVQVLVGKLFGVFDSRISNWEQRRFVVKSSKQLILQQKEINNMIKERYLDLFSKFERRNHMQKYRTLNDQFKRKKQLMLYQQVKTSIPNQTSQVKLQTIFVATPQNFQSQILVSCSSIIASPTQNQIKNYQLSISEIARSFVERKQQALSQKINGRMIYETEVKNEKLKLSDQLQMNVINKIIERDVGRTRNNKDSHKGRTQNKRSVNFAIQKDQTIYNNHELFNIRRRQSQDKDKGLVHKQQEKPDKLGNDQHLKNEHREFQIIKKIRRSQPSSITSSNKSSCYSSIRPLPQKSNPDFGTKLLSYQFQNARPQNKIQNLERSLFENHRGEGGKGRGKNRVEMREQKRLELNRYIHNMCNNSDGYFNSKDYIYREAISNQGYLNSPNNGQKKLIKYSKYPISFNNDIEFRSQNPENCTIIYNTEDINIKQLTLRFIRDRRRYGVNKVEVRINSGLTQNVQDNDQSKKAMRIIQILDCLGANVRIGKGNGYRMIEKKQSTAVELIAFFTRQNIQKVWQSFEDMNRR